ncbi:MAG: hypothetical protein M0T83_02220, partial [Nitrospiraceae bacterium]|nr:hypothetical protein [Nitrospiraceae bacterium]
KIGKTLVQAAYDMAGGSGEFAILSATSHASNQNLWRKYMKDQLKLVYSLSLSRGEPGQLQLFSPQIKNAVDYFHVVPEKDMLGRYLDRKSGIPPIILSEIDRRLSELVPTKTDG